MLTINQKGKHKCMNVNKLNMLIVIGIVCFSMQSSYSQYFNTEYYFLPNSVSGEKQEFRHEPYIGIEASSLPELPEIIKHSSGQLIPGYTQILDSVYEVKNFGYYAEYYRWYYKYTDYYKLDSIERYFYNGAGEIQNTTELRKYNSSGQLIKMVRRQPDIRSIGYYSGYIIGDSTIIDYNSEEYKYKDDKLIWKKINELYGIEEIYFTYDEQGRLIKDSTLSYTTSRYFYDSDNNIDYILTNYIDNPGSIRFYKFTYDETDTTLLTNKKYIRLENITDNLILDTISHWRSVSSFYETFDEKGRRTSLEFVYWSSYRGEEKRFKAEYEYTQQDDLLLVSYYHNWKGTIEEGEWLDTTRIEYTYDEDDNILLYKKTFYDARSEKWIIDNKKEYFYIPVSGNIKKKDRKFSALEFYPNPVHNKLTLKGMFNPPVNYTIVNLTGIILSKGTLIRKTIDISWLEAGIYLLIIETDSGLQTSKFLKH